MEVSAQTGSAKSPFLSLHSLRTFNGLDKAHHIREGGLLYSVL